MDKTAKIAKPNKPHPNNNMTLTTPLKTTLAAAAVTAGLALSASAAVTVSGSAPTQDSGDIYNLTTTNSGDTHKFWSDAPDPGQSFTTVAAGTLDAFSLQVTAASSASGMAYNVDVYLMDGANGRAGTLVSSQNAGTWTNPVDIAAGDWITFSLDIPVALGAATQYGVTVEHVSGGDWNDGIPNVQKSGNNFAGGDFYQLGEDPQGGKDLVFHANIEAVPEPSATALLGLAGLALILRRRK